MSLPHSYMEKRPAELGRQYLAEADFVPVGDSQEV